MQNINIGIGNRLICRKAAYHYNRTVNTHTRCNSKICYLDGKDVIICKTKKGRTYYGCEGYPDCDFMNWNRPVEKKCPKCKDYMVIKGKKLVCQNKECGFVCDKEDKAQGE